jgi:hypothetical protein
MKDKVTYSAVVRPDASSPSISTRISSGLEGNAWRRSCTMMDILRDSSFPCLCGVDPSSPTLARPSSCRVSGYERLAKEVIGAHDNDW